MRTGLLSIAIAFFAFFSWAPEAEAYDQYSVDGNSGNCFTCHLDFRGANWVSLKDGTAWGTNLHDGHRTTMLSRDCSTCHGPSRFPVILNSSNGGNGLAPVACVGCHGRAEDAGTDTGVPDPGTGPVWLPISDTGAGLRQQHWIANRVINGTNTQVCADCHADANPANYTPVAENVNPPYYFTPDANHPNKPTNPCNDPAGTESIFGPTGLDNDGNGQIDGADTACGAVNLPPVANNDSYTTSEDTALVVAAPGVLGNDSDPEGSTLSAVLQTGPTNGTLSLAADGSFTYTPNANFNGSDSFTYFANDGTQDSAAPATVTITVNAVNDAPVAVGDSYTTAEDVPLVVAAPGVLANDSDVDGGPLSALRVPASGPANGSLTFNANGSFTYTPNANFSGSDSFRYVASDGAATSAEATVNITVNAINDAPVAVDDAYTTDEDVPLVVAAPGVLGNDSDAEGSALAATLVSGVANGTLSLAADGSFTYTPNAGFNGSDSFTYTASDGAATSNTATVDITVNAVNDLPVAVDDSYTTDEDVPLVVAAPGVLGNDSDADGDALTAVQVAGPANGILSLAADGSFTYTPNANFNGADSFTYVANDGTADSNLATVSITVNAVNDAPVAADDAYATDEDVALVVAAPGVLGNDTDVDGDALSAAQVAGPANGTLSLAANGSFTYTPNAGFNGSDSFTYTAGDGTATSNTATVSITVNPVNDVPVAADDSYTTDEDVQLVVTAPGVLGNDTDADGDALTAVQVAGPSNGTLTLNPDGSFTYTPNANFNGSDGFTYVANDGTADSNVATVSITVNAVNDAPVAVDDAFTTDEDVPLVVAAPGVLGNDTDADGDALTATVVASPANGSLALNADGSFTYTPNANFNGSDGFTYTAGDGAAASNVATVSITVNAVNDAPVAVDDAFTTDEDVPLVVAAPGVLANDTDADGDGLAAALVSGPANGTLSLAANGSFTYTPNANFNGSDGFSYSASDGTAASNVATVGITVTSVNDVPVANAGPDQSVQVTDTVTLNGGGSSDADGDALTFLWSFVSRPAGSGATLSDPTAVSPTFVVDVAGNYVVQLVVNDGTADSAPDTMSVSTETTAPVAADDSYTTDEDVPLVVAAPGVLANDTDVDGDPLTASVTTGPANGILSLAANGSFTYTPNADFNGSDSFTYVANDGTVDSNVATVSITINAVNDAPVAVDDSYTTDEDVPLVVAAPGVLGNDSDVDGDALTALQISGPANGTLTLNADGSFNYTPNADFNGADSFTYNAGDGAATSNTATVSITVNAVNDPPVAVDDSYTTDEDVPLSVAAPGVLANDSDVDGDALTALRISGPASGTLTLNADGSFTYTPNANFNGSDAFSYVANDGTLDSNVALVSLTVNAVNDPPVANAGPDQTALVGDTVTLNGGASSDVDGDPLTFVWSLVSVPAGSAAALSDPTAVSPTFSVDLPGTYVAELVVNDGLVDSAPDTVSITTDNTPPVANAGPDQTALVGDTVTLDGSGSSDVDGDPLTYSWSLITVPAGSAAALSDPTAVSPTFPVDLPGTYVAELVVNDGTADSAPDTVSVTTDNSAPVANAGPDQTAFVGDTVTLNGGASSDVDGDPLTFAWSLTSAPAGSAAAVSDPTAVSPTFFVDLPGTYVAQLIVNDGFVDSAPDTVTITTLNSPPLANAGPDQTAFVTDTVSLNGGGSSDVDGDPLTFAWSFTSAPAGSAAVLSDPTAIAPTFFVDLPGTYVVQLVVNDGTVDSAPDSVSITTENSPPVADAGPDQTALVTDTVTLDGSGSSDVDGDALTFAWSFTSVPAGSFTSLSDPAAVMPTFPVDQSGTYVVQLIVNDGTVDSAPDTVSITTENTAPVADAGPDQTAFVTDTVTLDGSGSSDVDGDLLTYAWSLTSVPAGSGAVLSDTTIDNPTFFVDLPGTYVAQLIVNDGFVDSAPDTVSIDTLNSAPVANAGSDGTVLVGSTVALNGGGSFDVDGDPVTFSWSLTSAPAGSLATLSDPTAASPTFVADLVGMYVAQLIVNDGTLSSAPDSVAITASSDVPVGPDIEAPLVADYGSVFVGTRQMGYIVLFNRGDADLTITGWTKTGSSDFLFNTEKVPPFVIRPGRQVQIGIDFLPLVSGPQSGLLQIFSNDPDEPMVSVDLLGNGVTGAPDIAASPLSLNFGTAVVGRIGLSSGRLVTIANNGSADLIVTGLTIAGSGEFRLYASGTPFVVRAGRTTSMTVQYLPVDGGPDSATLTIASNDPDSPSIVVSMTGTGVFGTPDIATSPAAVAFGDVPVGSRLGSLIAISNSGTGDLTVTGLSIGGDPVFAINSAPGTPFVIAAGRTEWIQVDYLPVALATNNGTLTITSNDPDEGSVVVPLSGTGVVATAAVP